MKFHTRGQESEVRDQVSTSLRSTHPSTALPLLTSCISDLRPLAVSFDVGRSMFDVERSSFASSKLAVCPCWPLISDLRSPVYLAPDQIAPSSAMISYVASTALSERPMDSLGPTERSRPQAEHFRCLEPSGDGSTFCPHTHSVCF